MNKADLGELLKTMVDAVNKGWNIVTWNGLGFDFDVLAEESGEWEICRELALDHIDMMFHFFCIQGYPLGLEKAAQGMGLSGKMEGYLVKMPRNCGPRAASNRAGLSGPGCGHHPGGRQSRGPVGLYFLDQPDAELSSRCASRLAGCLPMLPWTCPPQTLPG